MMRNASHVGRLRVQAAKIVNAAFPDWGVRPEDVRPAQGRWRTDSRLDVFRWELVRRDAHGNPVKTLGCWQTLTDFVGQALQHGKIRVNDFDEISAGP